MNQESSIKLSVIIPTNHLDDFFEIAVDSVLEDLPSSSELIIILNGQALHSESQFLVNLRLNESVRLLRSEEAGLVPALNLGFSKARGEFIARMDSDDISLSGRFNAQLNAFAKDNKLILLGTQFQEMCPHGVPGRKSWLPSRVLNRPFPPLRTPLAHPTVMLRTSAFAEVGGYSDGYEHVEDQVLWLKLLKIGRVRNLRKVFLLYRVHPQQVSKLNSSVQNLNLIKSYISHRCGDHLKDQLRKIYSGDGLRKLVQARLSGRILEKLFLLALVDYWELTTNVVTNPNKALAEAFRNPALVLVFLWTHRSSLLGKLAGGFKKCELCRSEQ